MLGIDPRDVSVRVQEFLRAAPYTGTSESHQMTVRETPFNI